MYPVNFIRTNWPSILTVVISFITIITFFKLIGTTFTPIEDKRVDKVVTIEAFETNPSVDTIPTNANNDPLKIHHTCSSFSKHACSTASYCVLLNGEQCVGGNKYGPTFLTNKGIKVDHDYYLHKGKCKGRCP
jgi:hypothetical protein